MEINIIADNDAFLISMKVYDNEENIQFISKLGDLLLKWLKQIAYHCVRKKHKEFTPSDFAMAQLTQSEMEHILKSINSSAEPTA